MPCGIILLFSLFIHKISNCRWHFFFNSVHMRYNGGLFEWMDSCCCCLPLLLLFEGNARIILPTAILIQCAAFHRLETLGRGRFWSSRWWRWRPTGAGLLRPVLHRTSAKHRNALFPPFHRRFQHRQWSGWTVQLGLKQSPGCWCIS